MKSLPFILSGQHSSYNMLDVGDDVDVVVVDGNDDNDDDNDDKDDDDDVVDDESKREISANIIAFS